jgi:hypothetical protein
MFKALISGYKVSIVRLDKFFLILKTDYVYCDLTCVVAVAIPELSDVILTIPTAGRFVGT